MTLLGLDISHFQQGVNFAQVKASGRDFVVLKATDGIGYTDPTFVANRRAAHAAGLIVGLYHFAEAGVPANEAAYFCGVVGALQPNEFLVLDWEKAYTGDHVAWCKAWLDAVHAKTGLAPLIYMNASTMNGRNWAPVAGTYGLWLAKYDNSQAQPAVTSWSAAAMKQYSDAGTVLGVPGTCDVDVFYGTTAQLLAYCTPGGTDMPLTDADVAKILDWGVRTPDGGVRTLSQLIAAGPALVLDAPVQKVDGNGQPIAGALSSLRAFLAWDDPKTLATRDAVAAGVAEIESKLAAPTVDAKALADALVADTQAVSTLADALAAAIAHRLGNG